MQYPFDVEPLFFLPVSNNLYYDTPTGTDIPEEKGLVNKMGENNCFLNVVIQSLWHLDSFRSKFSNNFDKHQRDENHSPHCVFCSLEVIFTQYEFSPDAHLPPTALRETLAVLFKRTAQFQLFELDDAREAFDAVLECLHNGNAEVTRTKQSECADRKCLAHRVFGINTYEILHCDSCGASSAPVYSTLFTTYSYSAQLRAAYAKHPDLPFCKLLYKAAQDKRCCPNKGKCDKMATISHYLTSLPQVFTASIVWDSLEPSLNEIETIFRMISSQINLKNVFNTDGPGCTVKGPCIYQLRGMICYYGKHYNAFFYSSRSKEWFIFDDTYVRPMGNDWSVIQARCLKGRMQPSVLFYEYIGPEELLNLSVTNSSLLNAIDPTPPLTPIQINSQSNEEPEEIKALRNVLQEDPWKQSSETGTTRDVGVNTSITVHELPKPAPAAASVATDIDNNNNLKNRPATPSQPVPSTPKKEETAFGSSPPISVSPPEFAELSKIKISKIVHDDIEGEIQRSIKENELSVTSNSPPAPEKSFIFMANDDPEEVDFTVTRTNWLYRKQVRRYRFKKTCFLRIVPGTGTVKDTFDYKDVFDITITDSSNIIIRFYSGKETQYIQSDRIQEIIDVLQRRAKALSHTFPVKKA